jgi:hypothetical protein
VGGGGAPDFVLKKFVPAFEPGLGTGVSLTDFNGLTSVTQEKLVVSLLKLIWVFVKMENYIFYLFHSWFSCYSYAQ